MSNRRSHIALVVSGRIFLQALLLLLMFQNNAWAQQTTIPLCNQTIPYSGMTYGYWFTAPTDMVICGLYVPDSITSNTNHWGGAQWIEVVRFTAGPPPTSGTTNDFVSLFTSYGQIINGVVPANIVINAGDQIGIYGSRDPFCYNSGYWNMSTSDGRCVTQINGFNVLLTPSGMSRCLVQEPMNRIWQRNNTWMSRVFFDYNCCETPVPGDTIQGPRQVCKGDTSTYSIDSIQGADNYIWSGPFDAVLLSGQGTRQATFVFGNNNGDLCLRASGSCGDTILIHCITVQTIKPVASFVAADTVCQNQTFNIYYNGTSANNIVYNWNFDDANIISGSSSGPYEIVFENEGNKTLQLQITQQGCASETFSKQVYVAGLPIVNFSLSKDSVCPGETIEVITSGALHEISQWNWDFGNAIVESGNNEGPFRISFETPEYQSIRLEAVHPCGVIVYSDSVWVKNISSESITATNLTGCEPLTLTLEYNASNVVSVEWTFSDGFVSSDNPVTHVFYAGMHDVSLAVEDAEGCSFLITEQEFIRVFSIPIAAFDVTPDINDPVRLNEASFSFNNQSLHADNYFWQFGDGNESAVMNPVHLFTDTGSFTITLISSAEYLCFDTTTLASIVVIPNASFYVPNAFTPNADGVNDVFAIYGPKENLRHFNVAIFDRWGSKIYEAEDASFEWNGKVHGKQAPAGVYVYNLSFVDGSQQYRLKGSVTLIR